MVFITLSVIQSTLIFITFKLFDRYKVDNWQAIFINYLVASLFSAALINKGPGEFVDSEWLPYSVILGFMFIATFYFFALSSQKAGVAVTSVTSKMSVIIPVVFGAILYGETLGTLKIFGIAAALVAFYLVFKKSNKPLLQVKWIYLPVMVFLGNGFVDTGMKFSQHNYIGNELIPFLMFTFATGMTIAFLISLFRKRKGEWLYHWKNLVAGTILGLLNFGSTYFLIKALGVFESSVVFPITNSAIVGLSALAGYFGFREKLSPLNWFGIVLAIAAIITIANA
jgi:drug/metabolite transporter (DMT)-like permease